MGLLRSTRSDDGEQPHRERLAAISPGVPGRCPDCDGLGYIDSIDIGYRYQIQHCKDCGHRWEYLFDDEGALVGLTELDATGQPRSRTRIRPLHASTTAAEPAPADDPVLVEQLAPADDPAEHPVLVEEPAPSPAAAPPAEDVVDVREPAPPVAAARAEHMSPAEWLRHSLRR